MITKRDPKTHWLASDGHWRPYHFRVCEGCEETIRTTKKSNRPCTKCRNNESSVNPRAKGYVKTNPKRYTRTCIDCEDVQTGRKVKPAEPQLCADCSRIRVGKANKKTDEVKKIVVVKPKTVKPKAAKKIVKNKSVSKEAIAQEVKRNRLYKEAVKDYKENKMEVIQTKSDKDMITEFLTKSKPSVIDSVTEIPHLFNGNLGSGTSVMGT